MAEVDITRLMDDARVHLPGATDAAIRQQLFLVMDEFFRTSGAWREDIPLDVLTTETVYDVESEDITACVDRLVYIVDANETPVRATVKSTGRTAIIELYRAPAVATTYTAQVILTVTPPTDAEDHPRFPSWIIERYRQFILAGLLGQMMSQPAKPYANERLAIYHLRRFQGGMSSARSDADRSHLRGGQAWCFPGGWV